MSCGCKNKSLMTAEDKYIDWSEVKKSYTIITNSIALTSEELSFLYELHNRIFIKNKQLNTNCSSCLRRVKINLLKYYESRNERETEGFNE